MPELLIWWHSYATDRHSYAAHFRRSYVGTFAQLCTGVRGAAEEPRAAADDCARNRGAEVSVRSPSQGAPSDLSRLSSGGTGNNSSLTCTRTGGDVGPGPVSTVLLY